MFVSIGPIDGPLSVVQDVCLRRQNSESGSSESTKDGSYCVKRRFSDFLTLYQQLERQIHQELNTNKTTASQKEDLRALWMHLKQFKPKRTWLGSCGSEVMYGTFI